MAKHQLNAYRLAVCAIADPLYPAAQLLFAPTFDVKAATRTLAHNRAQVVQFCLDILDTEALWYEGSPGDGFAPIHAVHLLAYWKPQEAIPHLWRIMEDVDDEWIVAYEAYKALSEWGPTLVDDLLNRAERAEGDTVLTLGLLLGQNGRGDPRAHDWIMARFEEQPDEEGVRNWAECLLLVDGEAAVPHLEARFDQYSDRLQGILRGYIRQTREAGLL